MWPSRRMRWFRKVPSSVPSPLMACCGPGLSARRHRARPVSRLDPARRLRKPPLRGAGRPSPPRLRPPLSDAHGPRDAGRALRRQPHLRTAQDRCRHPDRHHSRRDPPRRPFVHTWTTSSTRSIFTGAKGATLRRSNFQTACKWRESVAAAGLPGFHFHDLRHTGNTLAFRTGASLADLMARMGHASTRAAMIYQHTAGERDEHIADALSSQIKQSRGSGT
ncbi:tyrosine-type recombinase/integrase [Micromonospora sp. WMMD736]|uniref:tyrosine-type recombinase/integrase n=1 Tax=Micromonospora sp. WMMD736 TaxID=3404112 RepID=UPI003B930D7A